MVQLVPGKGASLDHDTEGIQGPWAAAPARGGVREPTYFSSFGLQTGKVGVLSNINESWLFLS